MQRAIQPLRRGTVSYFRAAVSTRNFSVGDKLDKKGRAIEDKYFMELDHSLVHEYKNSQDKQEDLKALVDILGPEHGLDRATVHKLCMWKHESDNKK